MTIHSSGVKATPSKVATSFDRFEQMLLLYVLRDEHMNNVALSASLRQPKIPGENSPS